MNRQNREERERQAARDAEYRRLREITEAARLASPPARRGPRLDATAIYADRNRARHVTPAEREKVAAGWSDVIRTARRRYEWGRR